MNKPFRACIGEIERAAGRPLNDDELNDLAEELAQRQQEKLASGQGVDQATRGAATDLTNAMRRAAFIAKRNTALNLRARLTGLDFVQSQFGAKPQNGLEALLVGINSAKKGSRASVAAEQEMLKARYGGGFISDMEKIESWQMFVAGVYDREISRALWAITDAPDTLASMPEAAVAMARVIHKWQEVTRLDANAAGADIGKLSGYITRQSHDLFAIRAAGFEAWKAEILPRLNLARTFVGADSVDNALRSTYAGLASGIHLKAPEAAPSGFKGPRNLAKSMSAERVLHFKSADDWFDYNARFGTGNLREAVMRGFEMSGQNTGIMRKLGPNPEANFNQMVDALTAKLRNADPDAARKFADATAGGAWLRQRLASVDGTARIPVHRLGAQIASSVRGVQGMAKLGGAVLAGFGDIAVRASELKYQGSGGYLSGMAKGIADLFKGRGSHEMRELDGAIGVFADSVRGQTVSRFSVADDGVPGAISKMQRQFFKWNLLTWWTDTLRTGAIRSMAHVAALRKNLTHARLSTDFQRVLGLYGIDAPRWEIMRQAVTKEADGRSYLTADAIRELPDEAFAALAAVPPREGRMAPLIDGRERIARAAVRVDGVIYGGGNHAEAASAAAKARNELIDDIFNRNFESDGFVTTSGRYVDRAEAVRLAAAADQIDSVGSMSREASRDLVSKTGELFAEQLDTKKMPATDRRIDRLRNEIADQYLTYLVERGNIAVLEPDARTRAIMTRGSRPGTVDGEAYRFFGQFKSFGVVLVQNVVGRELFGRGADSFGQAIRNGNGEMLGLAQLILASTLLGYAAMTAKDIFKGRKPRDPMSPKTWGAAFLQGGGAGIYGDFLFGDMRNRFGGTPLSTLFGPTVGTAEDVLDLYGRVKAGDKFAAAAMQTIVSNTPFANMFYTKVALDYLILYRISESLSPGYLRRLERRVKQQNDQEFLVRPSQAVR